VIAALAVAAWLIRGKRMRLIDHIKAFEGLQLEPYIDASGKPHIGYGHLVKPDEATLHKPINVYQADQLLAMDLRAARNTVLSTVARPLTQGQSDALTDFVYNVGAAAFRESTLLKKLKLGDVHGAAAEFGKWIHAGGIVQPGLVARREKEKQWFVS
jgi:lysozyme